VKRDSLKVLLEEAVKFGFLKAAKEWQADVAEKEAAKFAKQYVNKVLGAQHDHGKSWKRSQG
jgi:hypothetical protein